MRAGNSKRRTGDFRPFFDRAVTNTFRRAKGLFASERSLPGRQPSAHSARPSYIQFSYI
jgi:hypothetical protein